jgi:hypothetical protein
MSDENGEGGFGAHLRSHDLDEGPESNVLTGTTSGNLQGVAFDPSAPIVTKEELAEVVKTLLGYVNASFDLIYSPAVYIPPAQALRNQADAMERKDRDIQKARQVMAQYEGQKYREQQK